MFEDVSHDEVTIHAQPGDVFAFFSDGIVDASNVRKMNSLAAAVWNM